MRSLLLSFLLLSSLSLTSPLPQAPQPPVTTAPRIPTATTAWEPLEGRASWYSATDPGILPTTATNEHFDDQALTCAIWGVPFHSHLKVTNLTSGRWVVVRVNDRGPAEDLVVSEDRIIDLTKAAFAQIADPKEGLIRVRVELVEAPFGMAY